jgi:hypothetical protein
MMAQSIARRFEALELRRLRLKLGAIATKREQSVRPHQRRAGEIADDQNRHRRQCGSAHNLDKGDAIHPRTESSSSRGIKPFRDHPTQKRRYFPIWNRR